MTDEEREAKAQEIALRDLVRLAADIGKLATFIQEHFPKDRWHPDELIVDVAIRLLGQLAATDGWRPVTATDPPDEVQVLAVLDRRQGTGEHRFAVAERLAGEWYPSYGVLGYETELAGEPTHWMPLPALPGDGEEAGR